MDQFTTLQFPHGQTIVYNICVLNIVIYTICELNLVIYTICELNLVIYIPHVYPQSVTGFAFTQL